MNHSLHRGVGQAKGFYALYAALIGGAAVIVLIPGSPLGLITEGVQVLCGMLLPVATVFLLLLCNDKAVLGPWANTRKTNAFTGAVVAVLITLSVVLTASVLDPSLTAGQIGAIMGGCAALALTAAAWSLTRIFRLNDSVSPAPGRRGVAGGQGVVGGDMGAADKMTWRMPPLADLPVPTIAGPQKWGLMALQGYVAVAMAGVIVKIVLLAIH